MLAVATTPHAFNFNHAHSEDCYFEKLLELNADTGKPVNPDFYSVFANKKDVGHEQLNALIYLATKTPQVRAGMPIFEEACDEYIRIFAHGIIDVLHTKSHEGRANAFLHLIASSQNELLPVVIKDFLVLTIQFLNEEKAFNDLDLHDRNLNGLDLSGLNLRFSNLTGASLCRTTLNNTNLSNVNLHMAFLPYVELRGANLMGVNLIRATLSGANLTNATLIYANLSDALLNDANLLNANLTGVNLANTNLHRANLTNTNLSKAYFRDTILKDTNQTGTILTGAKNLHPVKAPETRHFWEFGKN